MDKVYVTRVRADRLVAQKAELFNKLREIQRQKGEHQDGGDCWHDNFALEDLSRQEAMVNAQIMELNTKIANMIVVDGPPPNTNRLRVGHLATIRVGGQCRTVLIGGFEDSDPNSEPQVISYLAPLVRPLIGKEVGFSTTIQIKGKLVQVDLEEIRSPGG